MERLYRLDDRLPIVETVSVVIVIAGMGLAQFFAFTDDRAAEAAMAPPAWGALVGLSFGAMRGEFRRRKRRQARSLVAGHMPASVTRLETEEGEPQLYAVLKQNGDAVTVRAPADYDPTQDGGQLIVEQLVDVDALRELGFDVRSERVEEDG